MFTAYTYKLSVFVGFLTFTILFSLNRSFAQKKENPPGTILLKDNIYIDVTPVCNIDYREYQYLLRHYFHYNLDSLERYTKTLPYYNNDVSSFLKQANFTPNADSAKLIVTDTMKSFWNSWLNYKDYLNNPKYNFFPMVAINAATASQYCRWRTYAVKLLYTSYPEKKDRQKFFDDFEYRLASLEELKIAAATFGDKKLVQVQSSSTLDSLPSFQKMNDKKVAKKFFISPTDELTKNDLTTLKLRWDLDKLQVKSYEKIAPLYANENLTFRCVCEIKKGKNRKE